MLDHISIAVRDLKQAEAFYTALLAPLGMGKMREWPDAAIGFGKKHPDFWINARPNMAPVAPDSGVHICLRALSQDAVNAFHAAALANGGTSDGEPGFRGLRSKVRTRFPWHGPIIGGTRQGRQLDPPSGLNNL